ncbi:MAG: hypothetical protein AB7T63_10050 [Planctomycetota bacterium]
MSYRLQGLATAAAFLFAILPSMATTASADIVVTRDGKFLPDKIGEGLSPSEYPSDDALQRSGKGNVELRYDKVKVGRDSVNAGFVMDVYCTEASRDPVFSNAMNQARAGFFMEAAASFQEAAETLRDGDRQVAMWRRLECLRLAGDADKAKAAAGELIAAFPEGYYVPQAYILLARIGVAQGKAAEARDALGKVAALPNVNVRDLFEAAVSEIDWLVFPAARNAQGYAAAEKAYRDLVQKIKGKNAAAEAAIPLMKAQVGIGKSLVAQGKGKDALPFFTDVVNNKESLTDKSLLASAYKGLGDIVYLDVQAKKAGAGKDQVQALIDDLDTAALHYMRVCHFYKDEAGDSLQPAWQSGAQVLEWQFDLAGKRDAESLALLERSVNMYYQAHKMMPNGEAKRQLTSHIRELLERRDALRNELAAK